MKLFQTFINGAVSFEAEYCGKMYKADSIKAIISLILAKA